MTKGYNVKGEQPGFHGGTYDYETTNLVPGKAPDTMWMAVEPEDSDRANVALVGFVGQVEKFVRRVKRVARINLAYARLAHPGAPDELALAVTIVGVWPADAAKDVVMQLGHGGAAGYGTWAKEFAKLAKGPDRAPAPALTGEIVREYAMLFLQQCELATKAGMS